MTTIKGLLLLLCCVEIPHSPVACEHFVTVEINGVYDQKGNLTFNQVMWFEWDWGNVVAWRMAKDESRFPQRIKGKWTVIMYDQSGRMRKVTADHYNRTWTQYDREIWHRKILPPEDRRELIGNR